MSIAKIKRVLGSLFSEIFFSKVMSPKSSIIKKPIREFLEYIVGILIFSSSNISARDKNFSRGSFSGGESIKIKVRSSLDVVILKYRRKDASDEIGVIS